MVPQIAYSERSRVNELAEQSDRQLLEAMQSGDELAFDELVRRKTQPLVQVAYRILGDLEEAKDAVQIALVKVWDKRGQYRTKWSPNTWIYRITTNLAIDILRSQKSRDRVAEPLRLHVEQGSVQERPSRDTRQKEVEAIFAELAAELTEKQRTVFVLRELEGLSSPEVARIVGCRESTVRNHLFNARAQMREQIRLRYPEYLPGKLR